MNDYFLIKNANVDTSIMNVCVWQSFTMDKATSLNVLFLNMLIFASP